MLRVRLLPISVVLLACGGPGRPGETASGATEGSTETGHPTTGVTTAGTSTTDAVLTTGGPGTASGTSGSGPDPSTGTTGECSFICEFDVPPSNWGCDGGWEDSCPPGQKCTAYGEGGTWNALKCVPVMDDPVHPGDECFVVGDKLSGLDNCDAHSMCWSLDDNNQGVCVAHCTGSEDEPTCADPATQCVIANDGVLNLCLPRCDPLVQDCPQADDLCVLQVDDFVCVVDASGPGGQIFTPCEYANACDPGLACRETAAAVECDPEAGGCCVPYCDLDAPDPDAPCVGVGQVCVPLFDVGMAPAGDEDVGVCSVPA